jgi:enoyl-CoA hydratase
MTTDELGTPYLTFERVGSVAWCIVNRPESRNALTPAMYLGIRRAVDRVNDDPELAALVITGVGDVFIPGGELSGREDDGVGVADVIGVIRFDLLPFRTIRNSRAPVVTAINGICHGGGLIIALASDVAVASDRATFRAPETLRGVVDANMAAMLPAHVGVAHARDMLMSGRRVGADEACRMGLVARVVPHDDLRQGALDAVGELLRAAPDARSRVKSLINARYGVIDEIGFEASVGSEEVVEGFRAFTEKRMPDWVPEEFRSDGRL